MCGIAGFVLREREAQLATVRAMCDTIRHRGPDDEGVHLDGGCALGMRRLSIIDLSTGHQPMSNEDGTVWVVFNGEIYNYQALRRDLITSGHQLRTNSDTEALVHLYEQHGAGFLPMLRGMFAFAIWDARRRRLFLARDRFGKKPLYYAERPDGLYFASELKCLRAARLPLEPDREALRLYFQFGYVPDPRTAYAGVRKLPPGSWLMYDAKGGIEQGMYWRPPVASAKGHPGIERAGAEERLRDVFDTSVRVRMIADVPLGAFLSGGIDSSSVVASMALASPEPVKTFSIGFEEARYNELAYAAEVAKQYQTEHHEIVVRPDSVDLIGKLAQHFDEPFADSSAIPTYIVSEFAARHVKVALSGDGGDELFGGYERFATAQKQASLDRMPGGMRAFFAWTAERLPYSAYGKNYLHMLSRAPALARYLEGNFAPYYLRKELLQPQWMLPAESAYLLRAFAGFLAPEDAGILSQAMYFESAVNLPGDMLVKVDRMSMANSLEVRCPMLDHELADVAASIPHAWRIRNGTGKQFFIDAMGDRLPPSILNRPKMGFAVPLADWFRGPLRELVGDHLLGKRFLERGIVSPPFVEHLLDEHARMRRDNSHWLYSLLMLELWFRQGEAVS
ncbi:MAG TPA: asparagine synthase (glutamine-hydrolyzing) [Bryobacteraceae bacterium]